VAALKEVKVVAVVVVDEKREEECEKMFGDSREILRLRLSLEKSRLGARERGVEHYGRRDRLRETVEGWGGGRNDKPH
jgi:hypothetical protein